MNYNQISSKEDDGRDEEEDDDEEEAPEIVLNCQRKWPSRANP